MYYQLLSILQLATIAVAHPKASADDGTSRPRSRDGRCGTEFGTVCNDDECCSSAGWCGVGYLYCSAPDCQINYGPRCDANVRPKGPATEQVPRPQIGNVPYGQAIYHCERYGDIALTFDDGPYIYTEDLLNLLERYDAKATFFVTGNNLGKGAINDPAHSWGGLIKRMVASGHQVASHTWSHQKLTTLSESQFRKQMHFLEVALADLLGYFPTYMRPPYSASNDQTDGWLRELGYHVTYFNLDTEGYLRNSPNEVQRCKDIWDDAVEGSNPQKTKWLQIEHDTIYQAVYNLTEYALKSLFRNGFRSVTVLCVSGPQLARGYLKRPDATAKAFRFVGGKRIYQTGDLARLLPSGEVELHGRKDGQVKLNGYRIELGEIDASIVKSGSFKTCVTVMATVLKKKQIVAFCSDEDAHAGEDILLPADKAIAADHITACLTSLPKYMLPTVWLPVATWPLTPNGKVDKKRLQQMVEEMPMDRLKRYLPREEKTAVSGEQELILQSIWADLFEVAVENIHGGTTFHSLGGDSISALNLSGLLRREGFDIKVNDLLSAQTLQTQAKLLSEEHKMQDKAGLLQDLPVYVPGPEIYTRLNELDVAEQDIEDIYPCSPGQVEFLTQGNKREQFWQLMTIREVPKDLDFAHWVELTTMLTARNQILRAMYVYGEEGNTATAVQVILKQPTLNLTYQSYTTEAEFKAIVDAEWDLRFDQAKAFVRYTLLTNSATGTRHILIKLDHASYDGTLLHIFDDQFKALNQGVAPRPSTEFRDFIRHIRETPKQPQLDYWTSLLKDKIFDYPARATNPKVRRWELSKIGVEIGVDETAQAAGVTAPIAFQTAYGLLLAHLSGSPHVVYNNLVTGRNVPLDNPQLINGNCANFLPFVHNVGDAKPIGTLLQETQASFWRTTENGLVSLDEIYGALGVDRDAAAAKCLFCFQPFEPVDTAASGQDHMRWIVMKMSRSTMHFNYAMQLEVVKGARKGEYVVKLGFDDGVFTVDEARGALAWYEECLKGMSGKV